MFPDSCESPEKAVSGGGVTSSEGWVGLERGERRDTVISYQESWRRSSQSPPSSLQGAA